VSGPALTILIKTALIGIALVIALVIATAAPIAAVTGVGGNVDPALDAIAPGTVAVVASGAPERGVVPIIVRNATSHAVTGLRVRATALDGDGHAVARAASRTVVPDVLTTDGLGLAQVDFRDPKLPLGVTYRFDVRARRAQHPRAQALEPSAYRLSPPVEGPVAQTLDVTMRNPSDAPLRGPVHVAVMCFGESRRPVRFVGKTANARRVSAGDSITTTIELRGLCPAFLIGGTATSSG